MSRIKNTKATVFVDGIEIGAAVVEEVLYGDHEKPLNDWSLSVTPDYRNAAIAHALNPAREGDLEFVVRLADGREGVAGASHIAPGLPILLSALSGLK